MWAHTCTQAARSKRHRTSPKRMTITNLLIFCFFLPVQLEFDARLSEVVLVETASSSFEDITHKPRREMCRQ